MNIVLINLTRFGDQLQSQAAINSLVHYKNGQHKLTLICLPNFVESSELLQNISSCYPLPKDGFFASLDQSWLKAFSSLTTWKADLLKQFKPDLIFNLTPSTSAAMLANFIAHESAIKRLPVKGFALDNFGFSNENAWATFLKISSSRRDLSLFNIVDLFRAVVDKIEEPASNRLKILDPNAVKAQQQSLAEAQVLAASEYDQTQSAKVYNQKIPWIGFQTGASAEMRQWPMEFFSQVGDMLWQELGIIPILFGSKDEEHLAKEYQKLSHSPFLSLIGKTNLQTLALSLANLELLLSNDTGSMHLAAGLNIPTLGIFLATAQPWDTGAYLENSCSLEPDLACHPCSFNTSCPKQHRCKKQIRPELIFNLIKNFLKHNTWQDPAEPKALEQQGARIWQSKINQQGYMHLEALSEHAAEARTQWFYLQMDFLRQFLDRDSQQIFSYLATNTGEFNTLPFNKLAAEALAPLEKLLSLAKEQALLLSLKPLPKTQQSFLDNLHQIKIAFSKNPELSVFSMLWNKDLQEKSASLKELSKCVEDYFSLITALRQKLEN